MLKDSKNATEARAEWARWVGVRVRDGLERKSRPALVERGWANSSPACLCKPMSKNSYCILKGLEGGGNRDRDRNRDKGKSKEGEEGDGLLYGPQNLKLLQKKFAYPLEERSE